MLLFLMKFLRELAPRNKIIIARQQFDSRRRTVSIPYMGLTMTPYHQRMILDFRFAIFD